MCAHRFGTVVGVVLLLVLAGTRPVLAESGTATLSGKSKLAVKGCGADRLSFTGVLTVLEDGTWTALSDGEAFGGTYTTAGRTGRKLALVLDAPSLANLVASVEESVSLVCESGPATVTASRAKAVTLGLDRKRTRAKLVVKYRFTGTADGRSGTANYRLVAHGGWTPGA